MKHLANNLNATFVLDFFHCAKRVRDTIGYGKYRTQNKLLLENYQHNSKENIYQKVINLIRTNHCNYAIDFLVNFINQFNSVITKTKINEISKLIRYLKSNLKALSHFDAPWYIGSRTEAFIENLIKKKWKRRNSTISLNTFYFFLKQNESDTLKYFFI